MQAPTSDARHGSMTSDDDDAALMARVATGDDVALGTLFDRHGRLAWSIAIGILGERETAREVGQDAWVDLWRTAAAYDAERASVTTWLVRLVRLRAVDRLRRERAGRRGGDAQHATSAVEEAAAHLASGEDLEGDVLASERGQVVRGALAGLPKEQRVLVELAFLHGYTHTELAAALGLPTGTIKTRLFRGLARLHELLAPELEGTSSP